MTLSNEMTQLFKNYFIYGGLPLSILANEPAQKLKEIRLTTERGFDLMSNENKANSDLVRLELAKLNSKEFTYQNILTKTRVRQRAVINVIIDDLINHGYLVKKQPLILIKDKTSYLSVYSFTDPGIVSYLTADYDSESNLGSRVEAYVHARLAYLSYNSVFKSSISYFKPYSLDTNKNIRYSPGEIDFIFSHGKRMIPIEVKSSNNFGNIDTDLICEFSKKHNCQYSVVLYGGIPHIDNTKNILFWPWWMI
jgi:predicted AAA+ superfamily ATPase